MIRLVIIILLFALFGACNNKSSESEKTTAVAGESGKVSELAAYMREVHAQSLYFKLQLSNEQMPEISEDYHKRLKDIFSAEPTDPKAIDETFEKYAQDFLLENQLFFAASKEEKIFSFNNMINSCVNCHKELCPGPIKKINKLKI
jgi:predicted transcriptional regulator YdeE